jgi:hypothetical protein
MRSKLALLLLGASLWLHAQTKWTVEKLVEFIRSSITLKQPDSEVAKFLRKQTLTEKLDDVTIEELQGMGAGPKTVEALNELRDQTRNLPAPAAKAPVLPQETPAQPPPPSDEEQKKIIEAARDYALNYTKGLPNYLCTQVTRRFVDPTGTESWIGQDTLTARLSYVDKHENYKLVLVNNKAVTGDMPLEAVGGATSTGEFASMLYEIFDPATETQFWWDHWAKLRGNVAYVFAYRVSKERSKWHVTYQKSEDIVPAYHGLVYIDMNTGVVLRLVMKPDVPASFPIQDVSDTLDYDLASIGSNQYFLPLRAEVRMREGKFLSKNEVEFRLYRRFTAEAQITFDTPDPLPDEKSKEEPVTKAPVKK